MSEFGRYGRELSRQHREKIARALSAMTDQEIESVIARAKEIKREKEVKPKTI